MLKRIQKAESDISLYRRFRGIDGKRRMNLYSIAIGDPPNHRIIKQKEARAEWAELCQAQLSLKLAIH